MLQYNCANLCENPQMLRFADRAIGVGASAFSLVLLLNAFGIKNSFKVATFIAGFKFLVESDIDDFGMAAITGMLWGASSLLDYNYHEQ